MIRLLSTLLLAISLIATGHAMASARGASAATGQMVICTGTGPMVVYVDAQGQPTKAPAFCPDAALHAPVAASLLVAPAPTYVTPFKTADGIALRAKVLLPRQTPPGRGPPLTV